MRKNLRIVAMLMLVFLVFLLAGCTLVDERAVGTVNGGKIGIGEYNFFLNSVKSELLSQSGITAENEESFWKNSEIDGKKASEVAKDKAFEQVVLFRVKLEKALSAGVTLSSEDSSAINAQIKNVEASMGGNTAFRESLKEIGMSEEDYKSLSKNSYIINKYFEQLAADETSPLNVSQEEAQKFYDDHKSDATFKEKVTAKHILISTVDENQQPLPAEQIMDAKAKADETYQKIKDGADFDALMNELSQDPGLATNPDGYTFGPGEMVQEFENSAFSLEINEVSEPVQSTFGYHIIKTTDIQYLKFDDISDQIKLQLQYEKYDKLAEEWRNEYEITSDEKILKSIAL